MPTLSTHLFVTTRGQSWLTPSVLFLVFVTLMLFAATTQAAVIFSEDFNGPTNLDATKWTVKVADGDPNSPYYGTSHPGAISFASGRMNVAVPGGANGYMGIPDGSIFTPIGATATGDYEVTIGVEELLRQQIGANKDNSGVALFAGDRHLAILGNYSAYFTGYSFGAYHKHRIEGYGPSGNCVLNETLGLNTLYALELRISRVGGNVKMGYRLAGQPWVDTPCGVQTGAASPNFQIWSGAGGETLQNGQFTAAVDYFKMTDTPISAAPTCTLTATPASITTGSAATLTAACTPAATSYLWTGSSSCSSTSSACSVTPTTTTTYGVAGMNASGTGSTALATVVVNVIPLSGNTSSDCLFNWAERAYPELFAPASPPSKTLSSYYYRYYTSTNSYLVTNTNPPNVFYRGFLSSDAMLDLGPLSNWLVTAGCSQ